MQKVIILGSTGSIGCNAIKVIRSLGHLKIVGIAAFKQHRRLADQIKEIKPRMVGIIDRNQYKALKAAGTRVPICVGEEGVGEMIERLDADILICAFASALGIHGIIKGIEKRMRICLATKEILVSFGDILMKKVKQYKAQLFPIDSEHSAIFQCLEGRHRKHVKAIILTASGGPFFKRSLKNVTKADVLKHPVWNMGKKITVDSATMMNKGLEVIEAHHLFDMPPDKIRVVIHPEALCHSLVEFIDASILAQFSYPDMRLPIQYALTAPQRRSSCIKHLNVSSIKSLHFFPPNLKKFPCLQYAYEALTIGKSMPAVLNAANAACVEMFLKGRISFREIPRIIYKTMALHSPCKGTIEDYRAAEAWAKQTVRRITC
ncbi:1-deoxy-D-xylulose-5-phosphate reductoisomerase [candidate division WOR-3 bacterium]|nr:1-deoxy-D-xylulose-5-phosphate reductoisomerase [candidate division WOR-3 bacterium]